MPSHTQGEWQATVPSAARTLTDARLQLHHATQFGTALGISYLEKEADDSHTNLGWNGELGALVSHEVNANGSAIAIGVRVADLTLLVTRASAVSATIPLAGQTIASATESLRRALAREGLDPRKYTLARHYEIPAHAVSLGNPFNGTNRGAFEEMSKWFGNAALELEALAGRTRGASAVRLWPHHFDIATLVTVTSNASSGAGMSAGDHYYDEPYFYVNAYPAPPADQLTDPLAGGGTWHTHEWVGAVLPGSRVTGDAREQRAQVRAYLDSAVTACRRLVTRWTHDGTGGSDGL
ncbi:MAG: hypothetical protein ACHQQ3_04075 [Gemmatimonadales bacterium]